MTPEGRIVIDLFARGDGGAAKISSTRPLTITRQFAGHSPEQIVQTVSLLFATCRAAQSIASAEAFEDALGVPPSPSAKTVRALLVLAETAREHALRILIDWPQFLRVREESPAALLRSLMQIDRDLSRALDGGGGAISFGGECASKQDGVKKAVAELKAMLEQAIFGEDLERWRNRADFDNLARWAHAGQTAAQRLIRQLMDEDLLGLGAAEIAALPPLHRDALAERLFGADADTFVAQPEWDGSPHETSALARTLDHPSVEALRTKDGHGLGARLIACLVDLSQITGRIEVIADSLGADALTERQPRRGDGIGIAQIEAARGRLVHAVQMEGDKVAQYRILAPTEWNFHPRGAAAHGLAQIAGSGCPDCATLARLFVTAADPCVGADVRVH